MKTIITDVTRMRITNVCVAAVSGDRTIRLDSPQPNDKWVESLGGLVPGDIVSVDWKPTKGAAAPHKEDGEWVSSSFEKLRRLTEEELIDHLSKKAFNSAREAFGKPSARGTGGNAGFAPGRGPRSLATILVQSVQVYPHFEGIRVDFADRHDSWTRVPLQDLTVRRHQNQCSLCRRRLADLLAQEFGGEDALLRVGLSRPFSTPQHRTLCWMQVNHIFLIPSKRKHFV